MNRKCDIEMATGQYRKQSEGRNRCIKSLCQWKQRRGTRHSGAYCADGACRHRKHQVKSVLQLCRKLELVESLGLGGSPTGCSSLLFQIINKLFRVLLYLQHSYFFLHVAFCVVLSLVLKETGPSSRYQLRLGGTHKQQGPRCSRDLKAE